MKLATYLSEHNIGDLEFAAKIKCDRSSVYRWRNENVRPDWSALDRIFEETSGAVTPNDFMPDAVEAPSTKPMGVTQ